MVALAMAIGMPSIFLFHPSQPILENIDTRVTVTALLDSCFNLTLLGWMLLCIGDERRHWRQMHFAKCLANGNNSCSLQSVFRLG